MCIRDRGNTVQNKRSIISYKVKKFRTVDKEEHIRVENTHEALIDKDVYKRQIKKWTGYPSKYGR